MVRKYTHRFKIASVATFAVIATAAGVVVQDSQRSATAASSDSGSTTFNVNVVEQLNVAVTTPSNWASGNLNSSTGVSDLLRNKINVAVTSNAGTGFTASMYASGGTTLVNQSKNDSTIATLDSNYSANSFPANRWGYSLDDTTYKPMQTTAITLISNGGSTQTSGNQDVYFGAKANMSQDSGTYARAVVISVVTGVIDNGTNPVTPVNPATPVVDSNNEGTEVATYSSSPTGNSAADVSAGTANGSTTYTYTRSSGSGTSSVSGATSTTTSEVTAGNNTSAYNGYTPPQGVTRSTANSSTNTIGEGSPLAIGLAVTAAVSATAGLFFFIIAKRHHDEEEEEEY